MNNKNTFEIVFRLFGLYLLFQVPFLILNIGMSFAQDTAQFITNIVLYRLVLISSPFIYFILSVVFIFKATELASFFYRSSEFNEGDLTNSQLGYNNLSFWIIIIGLFYIVSSTSALIEGIIKLPISSPGWFFWGSVLSNIFAIILSLIYIFRSNRVVDFIRKYSTKKDNNGLNTD